MEQKIFLMSINIILMIAQESVFAQTRIVGGVDVPLGQRKFQVSLQRPDGFHFCGASIISNFYVVTAAHCTVEIKSNSQVKVVIGTIDLNRPYKTLKVSKIINHEKYNPKDSNRNDIALIKVSSRMVFDSRVQPVSLPKPHLIIRAGTPAIVSGWGRLLSPKSASPRILQEVQIYIIDQTYCRNALKRQNVFNNIYPTNICAGDLDDRRGQCSGDSGGPLTVGSKLVGIVSWSIKDPLCASPKYPGVYTRVSEYIDWIQSHSK